MTTSRRSLKISAIVCGACLLAVNYGASAQVRSTASAQDYPNKSIRLIIGFAVGGPTDFVARTIGARLGEMVGQSVIIDNRDGASGMISVELVARSAPDGYTLLVGSGTALTIVPLLRSQVSVDAFKNLAPIILLATNPQILVVNITVPVSSVKDLVALAKSKPGQLNFASGGEASTPHLGMEMLKSLAGIDMVHVPYKGSGPAMIDLLAGQVQLAFNGLQPSVLALVKSGKVKGLAVSSAQRSPAAPDIPTVAETIPGFENSAWYGLYAPAKTPRAIISKLNSYVVRVLTMPEIVQRLTSQGAILSPGTPEQLTAFMRAESERLRKVIKFAGIKPI